MLEVELFELRRLSVAVAEMVFVTLFEEVKVWVLVADPDRVLVGVELEVVVAEIVELREDDTL